MLSWILSLPGTASSIKSGIVASLSINHLPPSRSKKPLSDTNEVDATTNEHETQIVATV